MSIADTLLCDHSDGLTVLDFEVSSNVSRMINGMVDMSNWSCGSLIFVASKELMLRSAACGTRSQRKIGTPGSPPSPATSCMDADRCILGLVP